MEKSVHAFQGQQFKRNTKPGFELVSAISFPTPINVAATDIVLNVYWIGFNYSLFFFLALKTSILYSSLYLYSSL